MIEFLKRFSAPIAFVFLLLVAALAMVGDTRDYEGEKQNLPWWQALVIEIVAPVQRVVSVPATSVRDVISNYVDLVYVAEENEKLKDRIAELEETNLQYREALVASGHLGRIAAMRDDFEVPMLPARVVGLDISLWFRSVVVDRGHDHGITAGNPIVTNNGVAGLVTATSDHAARAMLLLDRQSAVDGVVQRSRTRGVVRGNGTGVLEFEFVARDGDVLGGDVIITSGLDAIYPKGLRIGEVGEIRERGGDLIQTAVLTPAVDFERLEQIFVMFHQGPTMELLYGKQSPTQGATPNGGASVAAGPEASKPAS
ncbi:MAG: rod shape-determining protein MreC [bacterium]|nr:rod shape-determining protein MreC [bacterium]